MESVLINISEGYAPRLREKNPTHLKQLQVTLYEE